MKKAATRTGRRLRCEKSYMQGASDSLRLTIKHMESLLDGRTMPSAAHSTGKLRKELYGLVDRLVVKPASRRRTRLA